MLLAFFSYDGFLVPLILYAVMAATIMETFEFFYSEVSYKYVKIGFTIALSFFVHYLLFFYLSETGVSELTLVIVVPCLVFWLYWFRRGSSLGSDAEIENLNVRTKAFLFLGCTFVMVGSFACMHGLFKEYGAFSLLAVFLIAWITDTGAYTNGKLTGKRPMAKKISPNKTIEGLYGGYVVGFLSAILIGMLWFQPEFGWPLIGVVTMSLLAPLLAVGGDLIESAFKRVARADDSSGLLPGHGGVLDRLDSTIFVAPCLLLWSSWYVGS